MPFLRNVKKASTKSSERRPPPGRPPLFKALVAETLGTFFLMLTFGLILVPPGPGAMIPFGAGAMYAALITFGRPVSGGHFNPAVSLAAAIVGALGWLRLLPYWVAQLLGAAVAATAVWLIKGGAAPEALVADPGPALLLEFLFTVVICLVFLSMGENPTSSVAVGLSLAAGMLAAGTVSGGVFNPAVAVGLHGLNLIAEPSLWIYPFAGLVASFGAAGVFYLFDGKR